MKKQIIKPKIFLRTPERTSIPTAHKGKIHMDISAISEFKKLESAFYNPVISEKNKAPPKFKFPLKSTPNSVELSKSDVHFIALRKKIWGIQDKNRSSRLKHFMKEFSKDTISEFNHRISNKYPNQINVAVHFDKNISIPHAINFKWNYDAEKNVVHMFEWDNFYGIDSKNPIYKKFKEETIKKLKAQAKEHGFKESPKFIVDSERLEK